MAVKYKVWTRQAGEYTISYFTIPTRGLNSQTAETLTVWTLHGDLTHLPPPLQALRVYHLVNQWDYNIDVELGVPVPVLPMGVAADPAVFEISYEDMQQAQNRLITELLAGMGPDVILLDGCDAQNFAARGALMDLTELAREAGVYENMIESMAIGGELYYVPTNMKAPLLWGNPAHIEDVDSFASLAQTLYESPPPLWAERDEGQMSGERVSIWQMDDPIALFAQALPDAQRTLVGCPSEYSVLEMAMPIYGPWLLQENALDTSLLKEQYLAMKQMQDAGEAANIPKILDPVAYTANGWGFDDSANARYRGYTHLAATETNYMCPALAALAVGKRRKCGLFRRGARCGSRSTCLR